LGLDLGLGLEERSELVPVESDPVGSLSTAVGEPGVSPLPAAVFELLSAAGDAGLVCSDALPD
jgi:hypothetical protein